MPCGKLDEMGTSDSKQECTSSPKSGISENRYSLRSIVANDPKMSNDNSLASEDGAIGSEEPHDRSDGSDSGMGSEISEEKPTDDIVLLVESDNESSLLERLSVPQAEEFSESTPTSSTEKRHLEGKLIIQ